MEMNVKSISGDIDLTEPASKQADIDFQQFQVQCIQTTNLR